MRQDLRRTPSSPPRPTSPRWWPRGFSISPTSGGCRRLRLKLTAATSASFSLFSGAGFGAAPGVRDFTDLAPADLRAFLAHRRGEAIEARSLQRALSALKSLARHIARETGETAAALGAIRAPKAGRRLPRPLSPPDAKAMTTTELRDGEAREQWILARDAAVLALCYGAGLRISEALSIRRVDAPTHETDSVTITGKGGKTRSAPIIPPVRRAIEDYLKLCPYALDASGPLFVGAKGGPLSPRIVQLAMERMRGALGLPDERDAARASPFVRDASSGARRRLENHPGPARPRVAVDDAGLHGRRQRAAARRLQERASAGVRQSQKNSCAG